MLSSIKFEFLFSFLEKKKQKIEGSLGLSDIFTCNFVARKGIFYNEIRTLREVVRIAGKEKILFGTDAPALNIYAEVDKIKYGDISEEAKKAIFYDNAKKLFKL